MESLESADFATSPLFSKLFHYLANRTSLTLKELRSILPEKLFAVEHGHMDGVTVFSEIGTLVATREEAVAWIEKRVPKSCVVLHETRNFPVKQSTKMRREERFWVRIYRSMDYRRRRAINSENIYCGTYYAVAEIELRDLALYLNNR